MTAPSRIWKGYWYAWDLSDRENGRLTARVLNSEYPDSSAVELLAASLAGGACPTALELEGWEQYWVELGLDSQAEVGQTAVTGWTQPPLPGLEEV